EGVRQHKVRVDERRMQDQAPKHPAGKAHAPTTRADRTTAAHVETGGTSMTHDLLELVKDGVALLTLNRPDRLNAMSRPMLDALLEALPRLAADPEVGAVVLTGAGRAFCAGGDVKAMAEGRESEGTTLEEGAQALRARREVSRWPHGVP